MSKLTINDAIWLVLELAVQGAADRFDNPTRYRREMAAIKLVRDTFTK